MHFWTIFGIHKFFKENFYLRKNVYYYRKKKNAKNAQFPILFYCHLPSMGMRSRTLRSLLLVICAKERGRNMGKKSSFSKKCTDAVPCICWNDIYYRCLTSNKCAQSGLLHHCANSTPKSADCIAWSREKSVAYIFLERFKKKFCKKKRMAFLPLPFCHSWNQCCCSQFAISADLQ